MRRISSIFLIVFLSAMGCATQKESHTPRTGVEQLLVSSAIDQSLDRIDLKPLAHRSVFLETKYLDCVDKNYIIVSLHQRLLGTGARLAEKPEASDVVLEVASGAVGTDSQELFVGVPQIPLPPPSPISVPKMSLFTRSRLNGTAKLLVVGYDTKTRNPVIESSITLARSDHNNYNVLGTGTITTGSVPTQLAEASGEIDFNVMTATQAARRTILPASQEKPAGEEIRAVNHETKR